VSEVAVLLLTEDGSKWAFETLEQLCRRIVDWLTLTPQDEYGAWLTFAPVNDAARAEHVLGNWWKSGKPRDQGKVLRLCREIAEQILRPEGFVFLHIDSDVTWGAGPSLNLDRFAEKIRTKVRDIVRGHLDKQSLDGVRKPRLDYVMSKLILVAPYYSIEAWLFANVDHLRKLGVTGPILDEWQADPTKLEQTIKPKESLSVKTEHYPALARELKTAALCELHSSFYDTLERAGECGSLIIRLRHRWPDWVRREYGL
jgi:hypothetical protein